MIFRKYNEPEASHKVQELNQTSLRFRQSSFPMVITEVIYSEISKAISPHNDSLLMVRILYISTPRVGQGLERNLPSILKENI